MYTFDNYELFDKRSPIVYQEICEQTNNDNYSFPSTNIYSSVEPYYLQYYENGEYYQNQQYPQNDQFDQYDQYPQNDLQDQQYYQYEQYDQYEQIQQYPQYEQFQQYPQYKQIQRYPLYKQIQQYPQYEQIQQYPQYKKHAQYSHKYQNNHKNPINKENKKEKKRPFIIGGPRKNKKLYEGEDEIDVRFKHIRGEDNIRETVISCNLKDKISTLIENYRMDIDDDIPKLFMFNNEPLDPEKTVEESKLAMDSIIEVYDKKK